jgi:hypothetical protein
MNELVSVFNTNGTLNATLSTLASIFPAAGSGSDEPVLAGCEA